MGRLRFVSVFALLLCAAAAPASAEPRAPGSEFRIGASRHDPGSREKGGVAANVEVLSPRLFSAPPGLQGFVPRGHVGGAVGAAGGTRHVHAGFAWTVDLTPRLFVEGAFGLALHDGRHGRADAARAPLGCSWAFRESLSLGRRLTERLSVMVTVEHLSNAGLCDENRGLTHFGLRLGHLF